MDASADSLGRGDLSRRILHSALLTLVAVALWAVPLPSANEWVYLLRLEKFWNPAFLANDWTYSQPASEHFVFNAVFGLATLVLPLEAVGWVGRLLCWAALMFTIAKVGRHFRIPLWMISASIGFWLAAGQSLIGGEWVVGGFEAKAVSYVLLFVALEGFLRQRTYMAAAALGLSFSLHAGVGLWAVMAVAAGLLIARQTSLRSVVIAACVTGLCALPGVIPLLLNAQGIAEGTAGAWEFMARVHMPHHYDPLSWPRRDILALYVLYAFNVVQALRRWNDPAIRFLAGFEGALCLVFTLGIALRIGGQYDLLKFMPFRHFPIFVLLFFFFYLSKAFEESRGQPVTPVAALIGVVALSGLPGLIGSAYDRIANVRQQWSANQPDDVQVAMVWLRHNSAPGAVVIAPPWRSDTWWLSQRAQIASYRYYRPDHLREWIQRVEAFGVRLEAASYGSKEFVEKLMQGYRMLSPEHINSMAERYGASFLVTDAAYPFPVAFQAGSYRVYRIGAR